MTLDERLSALQAMLDRARETSAARGFPLPKDLPPRSQRTKSFTDQLADAEEDLVRGAASDALPVDDDEDLIDLAPETSLEGAAEPDSDEDSNGAEEAPGSTDAPAPAPIQLTAFAEEPASDSTMVSTVPRHVAVAAAAAARGELVRFGGGFPDEEGTTGDVDQIEAQALADAVIAKASAIRAHESVPPPSSEDPSELIDLGADGSAVPMDTSEPPEPEDDDDGLATLPPKARGRSSAPPIASGRQSAPIQLEGLDHDLENPPPARTLTGTDRPEPVRTPTGTDRPGPTRTPTGTDRPQSRRTPTGTDRPEPARAPGEADRAEPAPAPAGADRPQPTRTPTGTDRPESMRTPTGTDRPEPAPPSLSLRRPLHVAPPAFVAQPVIDPAPTFGDPPPPLTPPIAAEAPAPPVYVAPVPAEVAAPPEIDGEDDEEIELDDADVYESMPPAETGPTGEPGAPTSDSRDDPGAFFAPEEVVDRAEGSADAAADPISDPPAGARESSAGEGAPEIQAPLTEDEPPASQRQPREAARPIDDALEGVEDPAPESGEVESQRFASGAPRAVDTYVADETAQVRSLGSVDVIDRSPVAPGIVPMMTSERKRGPATFGDLLDDALELGASPPSVR